MKNLNVSFNVSSLLSLCFPTRAFHSACSMLDCSTSGGCVSMSVQYAPCCSLVCCCCAKLLSLVAPPATQQGTLPVNSTALTFSLRKSKTLLNLYKHTANKISRIHIWLFMCVEMMTALLLIWEGACNMRAMGERLVTSCLQTKEVTSIF